MSSDVFYEIYLGRNFPVLFNIFLLLTWYEHFGGGMSLALEL